MFKNLLLVFSVCVLHIMNAFGHSEYRSRSTLPDVRAGNLFEQTDLSSAQTYLKDLLFSVENKRNASATAEKAAADDNKLYVNSQINISNVYPNPASTYIQFDYTLIDAQANARIIIRNVLGSVVAEHPLRAESNNFTVSTETFVAGVYFYTLSVNNKNLVTKKFLVKK